VTVLANESCAASKTHDTDVKGSTETSSHDSAQSASFKEISQGVQRYETMQRSERNEYATHTTFFWNSAPLSLADEYQIAKHICTFYFQTNLGSSAGCASPPSHQATQSHTQDIHRFSR